MDMQNHIIPLCLCTLANTNDYKNHYRYFEIYWLCDVTNVHRHPYHICHGSTGHLEIICRNDIKHGASSRRHLSHDAAAVSPVCRGVHVQCARQGEEPPTHQCLLQPQPAQPLLLQPGLRADAPQLLALQELRGQGARCGVSTLSTLSSIYDIYIYNSRDHANTASEAGRDSLQHQVRNCIIKT